MPVLLSSANISHLSASDLAAWHDVPVAVAVDMVPSDQISHDIRPICPPAQQPRLFGRAVTAQCETPDFGAVLHALDQVGAGDVLVIATNGITSHAMIGEILCGHLRAKGAAGVICDGSVRDVAEIARWGDFPVFSRAITPRGPTGANAGHVQCPVNFAGRIIHPGDLIIGDDDGLVALSPDNVKNFATAAQEKLALEAKWIKQLQSGVSISETFGLAPPSKQ